jgi:hypothetical protein
LHEYQLTQFPRESKENKRAVPQRLLPRFAVCDGAYSP